VPSRHFSIGLNNLLLDLSLFLNLPQGFQMSLQNYKNEFN